MTQATSITRHSLALRTMRAAVITAPRTVELRKVPIPEPGETEVRVKIDGCGVCASNIPAWQGREWFEYPLAPGHLGHEAWGVVDAVGMQVTNFQEGERVAMLSHHAYAQYDTASQDQVVSLPRELGRMPFPAEPLGCAMNIFKRSGIRAGQHVAIVGVGFLGAILVRLARQAGAHVTAISRRPYALSVAQRMGAHHVIPMTQRWQIVEQVRAITGGSFCEVVIEAVGKQEALDLSGELMRERGRLVIAGFHQDGLRSVNMQLWNWRGIDVINAHERDPLNYLIGMREAVQAVAAGHFDPVPLFTHTYSLDRLGDALNAVEQRPDGFLKALIIM